MKTHSCIICKGSVYRKKRCRKCYIIYRKSLFHCTFKNCVKPVFAATLCQYHYRYWKMRCILCTNNIYCRSLCRKHYREASETNEFPDEPVCMHCEKKVYVQSLCLQHFKDKYKQSCIMVGCENETHKRGLCCKHYFRERRSQ